MFSTSTLQLSFILQMLWSIHVGLDMYIHDIQEACRNVINGQEDALQQLGLDNITYPRPKPHNTSASTLQVTYNEVLHTAVAARELGFGVLEKQCQETLDFIQAIAVGRKVTLQHEIDGRDVAEIMLSLIDEELQRQCPKDDSQEDSENGDQDQGETELEDSDIEVIAVRKNTMESQAESPKRNTPELQKTVFQIAISPARKKSEERKTTHFEKSKAQGDWESSDLEEIDKECQRETSSSEESEEGHKEPSDSEESDEESEGMTSDCEKCGQHSEGKAGSKVGALKTLSSSHHLARKCIVGHHCTYQGPNLKRHLRNVHVRKGHIDEREVDRLFAMGFRGNKKRGPARENKGGAKIKGRWKRWCPEPDCSYLGAYLSHHLQNKHHLKPSSSKYKTALKVAVRYKGLHEELEMLKTSTKKRSSSDDDAATPPPKKKRQEPEPDEDTAVAGPSRAQDDKPESVASPPVDDSDDQSGDDDEYPMSADFFEEKNPRSNRHKWLVHFYRHLFTPAAGFHKDRNRLQHANQVKRLLEESDPRGNDIDFIADDEGNRVWIDWVIPNLRKRKPGTVKSYLTSFELFLNYVSKKGTRPYLPYLDPEVKNELFDLSNSLNKWRRCITKETAPDKWDRYLDEADHLLTNEEVEDIMTSKPAVDGRAALLAADQADDLKDLSLRNYCDARDFLIVTLTRAVGTRPAPLENATIKMFQNAQWDDNKRRKVMMVSSHKRQEDGPAPIPMAPDTEYLLNTFINKLRPLVSDDDSPTAKIFLKADGAPFQKGTIGRRVGAFVVKSGIRTDKAISATDFRKWIVTELKRKKRMGIPIDEQLLRRLMCHSDKTANKWYLRESLSQQAAEASMMIEEFTKPSSSREEQDAGSFKCKSLSTKSMKSGTKVSEDFEDDDNHSKDQSAVSPSSASSKRSLSAKHHAAIKEAFAEDIENGVELRKNHVVAVMKSDLVLRALVNSESLVKKVSDRVRYLVQRRPTMLPEELPEETASTRTAAFVQTVPDKPPSSIESGRVEWSEDETMAIREVLTLCCDKCPTNDEIRVLFKRSSELIAIFKSTTFERIRNKVKNEFRKLKN